VSYLSLIITFSHSLSLSIYLTHTFSLTLSISFNNTLTLFLTHTLSRKLNKGDFKNISFFTTDLYKSLRIFDLLLCRLAKKKFYVFCKKKCIFSKQREFKKQQQGRGTKTYLTTRIWSHIYNCKKYTYSKKPVLSVFCNI